MSGDTHKFYLPEHKAHVSASGYDDGACLIKHVVLYTENDSCSYRWQGVKKAESQPGRSAYDAHPKSTHHVGATYIPSVPNFTTAYAPYGNQVHHVLNASSLMKGIEDVAEVWGHIRRVIVNGLLGEKYNLNHKDNNLILPTRDRDAAITGLPKHYGSHPAYSSRIRSAVKTAMTPYKTIANQMKNQKPHDAPDPATLKDALVSISDTMYANIVGAAAAQRGAAVSINDLPSASYQGI